MELIYKEQAEHFLSIIENDILKLEKQIKYLSKIRSEIDMYLLKQNSFSCRLGLSDHDAVCSECSNAIPHIIHSYNYDGAKNEKLVFTWPHGMKDELKDESRTIGCSEWTKKLHRSACGCGGTIWCVCGYKSDFCFPPYNTMCPYCGRILNIKKNSENILTKIIGDNNTKE